MPVKRFTVAVAAAMMVAVAAYAGASERTANAALPDSDGVVKVRSGYPMAETVARLETDIRAKGIVFFGALDQRSLASGAGISLRPSTLLTFGNPALGTLFLASNASAGLDWPVRLLVVEDDAGTVWAEYTDFAWIARRHHIEDRGAEFAMANKVVASIVGTVRAGTP